MQYSYQKSLEILERTPLVLNALLGGLSPAWTASNEGPDTWSPYDVVGHLIHGEKADWTGRIEIILNEQGDRKFKPFDRFAQFEESKGKTLIQLLEEFTALRNENLEKFRAYGLGDQHLDMTGIHPTLGIVKLRNLLATWVAHDLDHISQIVRVMAFQYKEEAGPWIANLRILK